MLLPRLVLPPGSVLACRWLVCTHVHTAFAWTLQQPQWDHERPASSHLPFLISALRRAWPSLSWYVGRMGFTWREPCPSAEPAFARVESNMRERVLRERPLAPRKGPRGAGPGPLLVLLPG